VRIGERVRGVVSVNYTAQCTSEKSFGTMVIVVVLECRSNECPRRVYWERCDRLCVLFLQADTIEYLEKEIPCPVSVVFFCGTSG